MLERLQDGLVVIVDPRQEQDALLRLAQPVVAVLDQADPLFVARQGVVQAEPPVFQFADHALQLDEGLLETPVVGKGVVHVSSPWSEVLVQWSVVSGQGRGDRSQTSSDF